MRFKHALLYSQFGCESEKVLGKDPFSTTTPSNDDKSTTPSPPLPQSNVRPACTVDFNEDRHSVSVRP